MTQWLARTDAERPDLVFHRDSLRGGNRARADDINLATHRVRVRPQFRPNQWLARTSGIPTASIFVMQVGKS